MTTVAPDSTSYPTLAAAEAYGLPSDVGYSLGWAIILISRREPLGFWEYRAWGWASETLSTRAFTRLTKRLEAAYRASGVIAS
jgi:hypothetical protein